MASIGINLGLRVPGPLDGRGDPYRAANFVVEIEGLLVGGFAECGGLQVEVETHEYREGGQNDFVHRFAGAARHPMLVLKRGVSTIDGLWTWHQDVVNGRIERRNGTIYLLNDARVPVLWWNVHEALPLKWTGPDLRAGASAVAFETVELAHRGLVRVKPSVNDAATALARIEAVDVRNTVRGFF